MRENGERARVLVGDGKKGGGRILIKMKSVYSLDLTKSKIHT